ncbi:MAG: Riboflavin synthase eubacterial/eukaryotic [uncultured Rubrobacteraceae bacterium]|uniref:Riboflavin synthase n=1 Tax=uncultured Rubrobacteraceae bacterium TaxID=349277 RepID=A0A6J4QT40_9ACTN|nr:MAG: Riboflavin synthase eubacterial/eukaryotic [uncultured Rubrobacteraceae bacterium]
MISVEEGGMARLTIHVGRLAEDARVGDSVSVNGVCLTANEADAETLVFYAMPETLRRTALGRLREGGVVNLERAMTPLMRFGGHIVQGHVDGVGEVVSVTPEGREGEAEIWEFSASADVLRYAVEKGSVCVDGISLTLVAVGESSFTVSILPQTKSATNLRSLEPGDRVNLEADIIGKYVERLLEPRLKGNSQTFERRVEDAV